MAPDLEARVTFLENRLDDQSRMLQELRTDLGALRSAHSADTAMLMGAIRDLRDEMGRRFEQVTSEMNARFQNTESRFEHIDEKIDRHFALLVGIQVATISAFVSALVALYLRP